MNLMRIWRADEGSKPRNSSIFIIAPDELKIEQKGTTASTKSILQEFSRFLN